MDSLSASRGRTDTPLLEETIGQNLRRTALHHPDALALVSRHQGFRATYAELLALTGRAARGLMARGIQKGDRVGLWSPNRWEWVVLQLATARVGAVLVNVNPAYKTSELAHALQKSEVSWLALACRFRTSDYAAMVEEVRPSCPSLRDVMVLDEGFEALLADAEKVPEEDLVAREATLLPGDAINIQYTSGTTGFPKGATLSHRNILNNGYFVGETLRYGVGDRVCIPVPFYHCFGMVMGNLACTSHGSAMIIPSEAFEPEAALAAVAEERCTSLYGVPTMFIAMLQSPRFGDFDLTTLRTGIMAGSPCPVEVMKQVRDRMHMPEVTICYGMTETSPVSTQTSPHDPLDKQVGSVGTVHPHVEVRIVSPETGEVVARGAPGELCTRGYSVMLGYWADEGATLRAVDDGGWMHTGDLATMDAEGFVNIVGRIKDMIIRGGENVYPREIEEYLHGHPNVADVQVIGVPSVKYGEEIMAWVKPVEGTEVTAEELEAHCRGRIATYKIPRWFKVVDAFPMTVTGKVQKFRMRELAIEELGLQVAQAVETA